MTVAWADLNNRLSYFLDDRPVTGQEPRFPDALRLDGWNGAQDVFAWHTAQAKVVLLSAEADGRTLLLPPDFLDAGMLFDAELDRLYSRMTFYEGGYRSEVEDAPAFWLWGQTLRLARSLAAGAKLELSYYALWPRLEYTLDSAGLATLDQDRVYTPAWAEEALLHLTVVHCLMPFSVQSAMNREYNIIIDSGTPIQNSRAVQAREHIWWYNDLVGRVPPQNRSPGVRG